MEELLRIIERMQERIDDLEDRYDFLKDYINDVEESLWNHEH